MNRIPLPTIVILITVALAVAFMVGLLSVRADCPEPTPPGGCGVDTITPPTATAPAAPTGEAYPPPQATRPTAYPAPEYLPLVVMESYPAP